MGRPKGTGEIIVDKEPRQVFIGGLPWTTTEEELRQFFKGRGKIETVTMPDKYCHVKFDQPASASRAVTALNEEKLGESTLRVRLDLAVAKPGAEPAVVTAAVLPDPARQPVELPQEESGAREKKGKKKGKRKVA